jgi:hypothetical protein
MSTTERNPNTDHCRSCQAEVVFVPSAKSGRPQILDAKPKKGIVLQELPAFAGANVVARRSRYDLDPENVQALVVDVYTDHHSTCPQAADWKGKKR